MKTFLSIHQDKIVGTLSMFDRMIFKGYLTGFFAAGRPLQYLSSSKESKEELARAIAERDGITEGLVCIFSVLESCMSFDVRGNRQTHKLEVVRRQQTGDCRSFHLSPG